MTRSIVPKSRHLPNAEEIRRLKVVVTTVSSDSHTWNLVWLQMVMEELGCEVINLGPCVPDEMVIESCLKEKPDLLLVSSVNGHGSIDGERMLRRLRMIPELESLRAVIGGKLGISGELSQGERQNLIEAGFDLVFDDSESPDLEHLKALTERKPEPHDLR